MDAVVSMMLKPRDSSRSRKAHRAILSFMRGVRSGRLALREATAH
jgi:hypothetical protein